MNIILFEDEKYADLLPLVYFRPVWELKCGMLTLEEKILSLFDFTPFYLARNYLLNFYLQHSKNWKNINENDEVILLNGRWLFRKADFEKVNSLEPDQVLVHQQTVLALRIKSNKIQSFIENEVLSSRRILDNFTPLEEKDARVINYLWDAIELNGSEIESDIHYYQNKKPLTANYPGIHLLNPENIFIDESAKIQPGVVIDAEDGPVWIDKNARIMPNAVLRGPLYIGKNTTIKIGAKIYENTTIGNVCKIGGEVEGSIILDYSNKQHDGFLGHSYLGSWVNIGADTNNSDLKNNYGFIKVYLNGKPVDTGKRFLGLTMGEHSKTAINTMFNTGTIVGVNCNVFGMGMPPKFMPSFSWGGSGKIEEYDFDKCVEVAKIVMARRKIDFGKEHLQVFKAVKDLSRKIEERS